MLSRKQIDFAERLKADRVDSIKSIDTAIARCEAEADHLREVRAGLVEEAEVLDTVLMPTVEQAKQARGL